MSQTPVSADWQTHAEKTNYRETPPYAETIEYAKRLAEASSVIQFQSFGISGQGRELPLLIASESSTFTPEVAREQEKAVVLIQACIHAGEPDGKDAGLALLRDIAISKSLAGLLQNVVLLFIPIYNTDGHERSSPYNRINQNGPAEMGWRTTTTYQNLNRDYMKADTSETRAWLRLWNQWQPDLFVDCHVTDGADYRSNITYHHEHHSGVDPGVVAWEKEVIGGKVAPATERAGNVISWYLEFIDNRDLHLGTRDFNGSPRFSTGYVPLRNRPGILIETHMIKEYRSRVIATYDFLRFTLAEVNRDPERLRRVGREADARVVTARSTVGSRQQFPLDFDITKEPTPFQVKAFRYEIEESSVSGDLRVIFGREPLDLTIPMYQTFSVKTAITPPLYYVVPREWQAVTQVIEVHGIQTNKLRETSAIEVESYRFTDVTWPGGPFEGRQMPTFNVETVSQTRQFAAGSLLVPLAQPLARLAINLLEPQAPDSFVRWGFFNAIFEQKEYGEPYVVETLARRMLDEDDSLRREFEQRLSIDSDFAASPAQRLEFFYKRSPYWDSQMNLYPVGRIMRAQDLLLD